MASDASLPHSNNVVALSARKAPKRVLSGTLADLAKVAQETLGPALTATFQATDDDLFKRSETDHELFDGLRELRLRQPAITGQFHEHLEQAMLQSMETSSLPLPPAEEPKTMVLSLVEENELEETLAVDRITAVAEQVHAGVLRDCHRRFAVLAGGKPLETVALPFGPSAVAHAFQRSVDGAVELTLPLKIVLYKYFERHVVPALGRTFERANQTMASAGILPSLAAPSPSVLTSSAASSALEPDRAMVAAQEQDQGDGGQGGRSWADLKAWVTDRSSALGALPVYETRPSLSQASPHELNQALAAFREIQGVLGGLSATVSPAEVKSRLADHLNARTEVPKSLGLHEGTIDAVGAVFEQVLKDSSLPPLMRALLSRLQLPFIKVAVLEPDLFAQPSHPARQLLDMLGEMAKGWSEHTDKGKVVLQRVELAVEAVNQEFVEDPQVFSHQLARLKVLLEQDQTQHKQAERRSQEVAKQREQLESAQTLVTRALVERTAGKPLPEWIRPLLLRDWASHMVLVVRKEGEQGASFRKALFWVEQIVGASSLENDGSRRALAIVVPTLVQQLKEGLEAVGIGTSALEQTAERLRHYLEVSAGMRGPESSVVPLSLVTLPSAVPSEVPEEKWLDLVRSLKVNDWVEFADPYQRVSRGKVAWVGGFTGKVLFVTISGARLSEQTPEQMAWQFQKGTARVLENKPLFERSIEKIMEQSNS